VKWCFPAWKKASLALLRGVRGRIWSGLKPGSCDIRIGWEAVAFEQFGGQNGEAVGRDCEAVVCWVDFGGP
jgi:hypothetical protein